MGSAASARSEGALDSFKGAFVSMGRLSRSSSRQALNKAQLERQSTLPQDELEAAVARSRGKSAILGRFGVVLRNAPPAYRVLRGDDSKAMCLGVGGSGRVYAVEHLRTRQRYAAKKVPQEFYTLAAAEIAILSELDHPAIVRLSDASRIPGADGIVLVLELLTGGSLLSHLQSKGRLAEGEANDLLRSMVSAIDCLHSHGIVHRDVKLENWVFRDAARMQIVLIDFGLATHVEPGQPLTRRVGTLHFMAPEVFLSNYGLECDMWSLGVVAHSMLVGAVPYDACSGSELEQCVTSPGSIEMLGFGWSNVSELCKSFVAGLLEKNPSCRLSSSAAMTHSWMTDLVAQPALQDVADLLTDLATFCNLPRLQQLGYLKLASIAPHAEREAVASRFAALSCRAGGLLTANALLGPVIESPDVSPDKAFEDLAALSALGVSCNALTFNDIIMITLGARQKPPPHGHLARAYKRLNDGCVDMPLSVERLNRSLGGSVSAQTALQALAGARKRLRLGADAAISFSEFASLFTGRGASNDLADALRSMPMSQAVLAVA